jgi:hypothetical protein
VRAAPRDLVELMGQLPHRGSKVLCLTAALELARLGMVDVVQERHLGPVLLSCRLAPEEGLDLSRLQGIA